MSTGCVVLLFIFVCLAISLTVSSDAEIIYTYKGTKTSWNPSKSISDPRLKRGGSGVVLASFRAIKKLTKGAQQVPSDGKYLQFEQSGDMVDSLRDIHLIQLENLKFLKGSDGHTTMVTGTKGDSHFTLLPFGEDGMKPIIVVRRIEDDSKFRKITHMINYDGY